MDAVADETVDFYTRIFGVGPAKVRPGYASFAVAQPAVKLVLFEGAGESGSINHLGVETRHHCAIGHLSDALAARAAT